MDQSPLPPHDSQPEHPRDSHTGRWLPGLILVVIGLVLLASTLSGFQLRNWWALFILIPAVSSLVSAWKHYQSAGRVNRSALNALFVGVLFALLATVFLFDLSWTLFGPLLLILLGGGMLISALLP